MGCLISIKRLIVFVHEAHTYLAPHQLVKLGLKSWPLGLMNEWYSTLGDQSEVCPVTMGGASCGFVSTKEA